MLLDGTDPKKANTEYINVQERSKLLWSLRSDFAWVGKKIPESIEIDGEEYRLKGLVRELREKELLNPDEAAEVRALIPKLKAKAKTDEELLETEELTRTEAEALYEEATGISRTVMELKGRLDGKGGEESADELKRMLNTQKTVDEKLFQKLLKDLK